MKALGFLLFLLMYSFTGVLAFALSFLGTLAAVTGTLGLTTCISTHCTLFLL